MSRDAKKPVFGVFDQVRPVQTQKQARGLKIWLYVVEYYPCGENKGADQLRSYCEAVLRLCFRIGKVPVFSCRGSYKINIKLRSSKKKKKKKKKSKIAK